MSTAAQRNEAISVLCQSIQEFPLNWGSWQELSSLVADQHSVSSVDRQNVLVDTLNFFRRLLIKLILILFSLTFFLLYCC